MTCFNGRLNAAPIFCAWLLFSFFASAQHEPGESEQGELSAEPHQSFFTPFQNSVDQKGFQSETDIYLETADRYFKENNIRESISYLDSALELATFHRLEIQRAKIYHLLGINYDKLSLYAQALDYLFQSLDIYEKANHRKGMADNYNSIGKIYAYTGDLVSGLTHLDESLEINTSLNNEEGKMENYLNLGVIHQKQKNYEDALSYYDRALEIAILGNNREIEGILTGNIGSTMMLQGQPKEGLIYLKQALELKERNNDHRRTLHTLNDIAEAKLLLGETEEAREVAMKVISLAREYEEGNQLRYAYLNLSKSYRQSGDFKSAYDYLYQYDRVKDSLFGIEKARLINELQIGYDTEKKNQAILSLQQDREIVDFQKKIYLMAGLVVLILVGILYIHQRQQSKRDRELLEKEKEVDRMKSGFFANISHEFRSPLTLILGPIESMLAEGSTSPHERHLRLIKGNALRLLRLVNQILDLSKLESGYLRLRTREADILPIIRGVTGSFLSLADKRNIALELELPTDPLWVYFDEAKLETILVNLISNAFKFSGSKGQILVKVASSISKGNAGLAEILVVDKGEGISPDQVTHIFDRFYQAGAANVNAYGGTGIGLALTKQLVELHRGTIKVDSAPGEGTRVTVGLLLGKEHLDPAQILPEGAKTKEFFPEESGGWIPNQEGSVRAGESQQVARPLVLIIEDSEEVREYLTTLLHPTYSVMEAGDGKQGIEIAKARIPDLIISDVMMPGMDGYEACRYLKQEELTAHIPVLLLTAKTSVDSRIRGHETEADLYLGKPFVPRELLLCVHNLIQSRKKLRERYNKQIILKPGDIAINSADEIFLERLIKVVEANFAEEAFGVDQMAREMALSRSQLHRKLQALTNESCSQFIRTFRLQRAMSMLKKKHASISEIAFMVGFSSPSYFNRCFLKHYGRTPGEITASGIDVEGN